MICMLLYLSDLGMVNVIVVVRGVPRCRQGCLDVGSVEMASREEH